MGKNGDRLERPYRAWKDLKGAPVFIWCLSFTKSSFAVSTLFIKAEKSVGELRVPVGVGESKSSIVVEAVVQFLETLRPNSLESRRKLRQQFPDRILQLPIEMPASYVVVWLLPHPLHRFVSDKLFQNDEVTNSTVESDNLVGTPEEIEQLSEVGKVSKSSGGGIVRSCGMEPESLSAKVGSRLIGSVQKSMQRVVKIVTPSVKADALH
jgi:hypothetical protein